MASIQANPPGPNTSSEDNWSDYDWNVPLDEIIDCTKCPNGCQSCYYKAKYASPFCKAIPVAISLCASIIMTALIIRFGAFNTKTYSLGIGDQRRFSTGGDDPDYSRFFCKASHVKSADVISQYVFTTKPQFTDIMEKYELVENPMVGQDLYPYWVNHMNVDGRRSDQITIQTCSQDQHLMLYIFNSKSDFQKFISSGGGAESAIQTCPYYSSSCSVPDTCHFSPGQTNTYYMTLVGTAYDVSSVAVRFQFQRLRYDMSKAVRNCGSMWDVADCSVALPLKTTNIILTVPNSRDTKPYNQQLLVDCIPRWSMYFAFFLGVPTAIALLFGAIAFSLYSLQKSVMKDVEQADRERDYRQLGVHSLSATTAPSIRGDNSDRGESRPIGPPPHYHIAASRNSGRAPLVERDELTSSSLPDYDSTLITLSSSIGLPSYDSLNS